MSKTNKKNSKENTTGKRGPKLKAITLPSTSKMTVADVVEHNSHIKSKPTIYKGIARLIKDKVLVETKETVKTGQRGKPATVFMRFSAWEKQQAKRKAEAEAEAKMEVPTVEITEPVPVVA
jgi:hypothetical protein